MSMTSLGGDLKGSVGNLTEERVLACESLPTLPAVAMELLEKTSNPDVEINEIAELIQSDAGLSGKVIKTVNSSFYGLSKPCPSIDRAIGMLGLRAVKSLVLGFSMVNLSNDVSDGFDMEMFWRRTIIAAAGARQVATLAGTCEPDEAFAAALFQDMGMLAIFVTAPKSYAKMVDQAGIFHNDLYDTEQERIGFSHAMIGAELAKRWRMPDQIVAAIRHHHTPDAAAEHIDVVRAVALGALAARCVVEAGEGPAFCELLETAGAWFGWQQQDLTGLLEKMTNASKEVAQLLGQRIGEMPDPQQLLATANQRLVEQQIMVQRESEGFQKQAKAYEQAATTDGLTGIANRKRFDEVAEAAMASAIASGQPIAVLFSDADKFKFVNDTYGHHAGDLVLVELAKRLTLAIGSRGTVCRYGGEEFAIVLPGATLEAAAKVGESMRLAIADTPFDLAGVPDCPDELSRTVSVGVASWVPGQPQVSVQELVQHADKAVYFAKESGRNNVKRWGVDLGDSAGPPGSAARTQSTPVSSSKANTGKKVKAASDTKQHKKSKPAATPRVQTVLIVEDDPLAARLMTTMFERLGQIETSVASDGRSAVEFLRDAQHPKRSLPDLIVCDVNLLGFSGLQILKALKVNPVYKHIPVAMVTSTIGAQACEACHRAGAIGVYDKSAICTDMEAWCRALMDSLKPAA